MKKSKIIFITLLALATLSLTSCLNDLEDFMGGFSGSPAIAELSESPSAATGTVNREIIDPTQPLEVKFRVQIAVSKPLSSPTTVTLALDPALVTAYNTERSLTGDAAAIPMPTAALSISSYEVTIPAGELEADWVMSVDAAQVPDIVAKVYLIPAKIVSATNGVIVSGNFGTKLMRVLSRNKYDGIYTVNGTFEDYITAAWSGDYPKTIYLITTGQYTVDRYEADYGLYGYIFFTGTGLSYFGGWTPYFEFDASDNLVAVPNSTFDPAPRSRNSQVAVGEAPNVYVTATRSMDIAFNFIQANVTPSVRSLIKEQYTFVGPRP
ncbi:MAG: DUF1735 domain-containing protein [Bacteroidales bacterium]|nr:DUF1735 domain-containing protein [Bacteroidales bacterium]MBN2633172.1 DUF1735 domain-containing protein [Bacteroidales bacterium]